MQRAPADRPLTDAKRRALVRSAVGPMVYRLSAATIAAIADDTAAHGLDVRATCERAAAWGAACRRALDAGEPLPASLEVLDDAAARAAAAAALAEPGEGAEPGAAAGAA